MARALPEGSLYVPTGVILKGQGTSLEGSSSPELVLKGQVRVIGLEGSSSRESDPRGMGRELQAP